jgi:hypothetical protein
MNDHSTDFHVKRIEKALRRGATQRNLKTLLILVVASTGALAGVYGLIASGGSTLFLLYLLSKKK